MTAAAGGAAGLSGYPRLWRTLFANHLRNRRIRKTVAGRAGPREATRTAGPLVG